VGLRLLIPRALDTPGILRTVVKLFTLLLALSAAASAAAQSALSLQPSSFKAEPDAPLSLSLLEGAKPLPWPADAHWLFIRTAGTQENRSNADLPKPGSLDAAPLTLEVPGAALIGLDLAPRLSTWSPEAFTTFAAAAGNADLCPTSPTLVEHLVSAAALLRITPAGAHATPDSTATSKSGQSVEIRPLMDPTTLLPGSTLAVRLYLLGDALPHATLTAHHAATGTTLTTKADAKAIANLTIAHAGHWRLELHTIQPITDSPAAFRAGSASLTFQVPEPATP